MSTDDIKMNFYRVREVNQFKNIDLVCEHSYPPIAFTGHGRCNFPHNPIFYSSNDPFISLSEVIRNNEYKNKKYCISVWKIKNDTSLQIKVNNFLYTDLHNKNIFKEILGADFESIDNLFKDNLDHSQKEGVKEFLKFIHSEFISDNNYGFSSALSHDVFYASHTYATDILIYPSNQSNKLGVNFGIHPNFVDNSMFLHRLYIVEPSNIDIINSKFEITFIKYADVINNRFHWNFFPNNINEVIEIVSNDFKDGVFSG